jgi:hypothetical protein
MTIKLSEDLHSVLIFQLYTEAKTNKLIDNNEYKEKDQEKNQEENKESKEKNENVEVKLINRPSFFRLTCVTLVCFPIAFPSLLAKLDKLGRLIFFVLSA